MKKLFKTDKDFTTEYYIGTCDEIASKIQDREEHGLKIMNITKFMNVWTSNELDTLEEYALKQYIWKTTYEICESEGACEECCPKD